MRLVPLASWAIAVSLPSQAAQLVGPVIDVSNAIRSTFGFGTATNFVGACRDNASNYWTTCTVGGQVILVRLSATGAVGGFIPTSLTADIADLAYDGQRNRIWVLRDGSHLQVFDATTGAFVGAANNFSPSRRGIAWNGTDRILGAGDSTCWDAQSLLVLSGGANMSVGRGMMFLPPTSRQWGAFSGAAPDPAGLTYTEFREMEPPVASMVPDLAFDTGDGRRGGYHAGCEAWLNPSTNEWLGIFCQANGTPNNTEAVLYTARLSRPTGPGCGGPRFEKGPSIVQTQVYAVAVLASGFTWLLVSLGPGTVNDPLLGPGCTVHLNPQFAVGLGPFLPNFNGGVSVSTAIPVDPSLRELPLWFQWGSINLQNQVLVSEARSAAIKQF